MAADTHQWQELLSRHGPALLLYARQFAAGLADAEDAVQEAFVRYARHPGSPEEPVAYLFRCVRSAAVDARRSLWRRRQRERIAAREESLLAGGPDEEPQAAERRARIEEALAKLPLEQREVLVLKIWGGLTFEQIAASLAIPAATAAARYRYALAKLKEQPTLRREVPCE